MKIIDKTPFVNENGELGVPQRVQGMLKFGFNWPTELQAQKAIVTFFDRQLEKGYTLIRNMTLGASGITVPMILLGPAGIYVIHVTYLRGRYEARGNAWNEESGNTFQPASTNLIQQTARMAAAVKAFIERQGVKLPVPIEPVLIAANPGLHVESVKPAVRVLMIDGIKSFVTGLSTAGRVLSAEAVHELTERIINPRPVRKGTAPAAIARPAWEEDKTQPPPGQQVSRARAIFDASEEAKPFNPSDFDFAMVDEEAEMDPLALSQTDTNTAEAFPSPARGRKRILGMTPGQLGIVAILGIIFLVIVAVFVYLVLTSSFPILP